MASSRVRREMKPLFQPQWSDADTLSIELASLSPVQSHSQVLEQYSSDDNRAEESEDDNGGCKHEHLLKSGPLGRCDDAYCTTCPAYLDTSMNQDAAQQRNTLLGRAKATASTFLDWITQFSGIYHPHTKLVKKWNQLFAVSCLIAVFIDPFFFFILSVKQEDLCIFFNEEFAISVTILRSVTDAFYFTRMLLQFRLAYFAPPSRTSRTGDLVDDPKSIALHYLKGWFIIDLVAVLPFPQVIVGSVVRSSKFRGANYLKNLLRIIVLLQYVPRMIRIFPFLFGGGQSRLTFETAWANFTINLFIYLLAGHVVGSCWYLLGLQRVNKCLHDVCGNENFICKEAFLDCGNGHINVRSDNARSSWIGQSSASNTCFVSPTFNYGIYLPAVPVTMVSDPLHKYIYSLCWGFLQISTLAGNLVPSLFGGEVLFAMGITGLGLLLFALLVGNMQNFLQSLGRRQLDMQLRRYDVETWMKRRRLPAEIQSRVRQAVRLKWASTRGVNEEEVLDSLPEDLQKEIRRYLCFDLVKKVRIFTILHEQVLDAICERLQQVFYIEGSELFRKDVPLHRMLFIVRGNLESIGTDGSRLILLPGNFCGEELLIWCLEHTVQTSRHTRINAMQSLGHRAVSSRTVRCLSSVEAFSLEKKDLEYVTENFARFIRNPRVQGAIRYESLYFRSLAAERIQAAWKAHRRRKLHSSGSDLIRFDDVQTIPQH